MSSTTKTRGILQTSVGKKLVMAITGLALIGFVIAHMLGNLQIFLGPERLNAYAKTLQNLGALLWVARIGLLLIFVTHLRMAMVLTMENRAARPVPYAVNATHKASFASRTMIMSGMIIFLFLVYHILHFTMGVTNTEFAALKTPEGDHDVYKMVIMGFSNPIVSGIYILAQAFLALHISHGFFSVFQTLGWNHPSYDLKVKLVSNGLAVLIFLGNSGIPVSVLAGVIK
ncbi:MAG: succinate dehydrogenase cytochrome b subunit [Leptospiraceae bacterium]|nr:succinate dehydrogenase cytochrome b subunit [Leptospiraceae bacterium]MCP5513358.1 succinate dehydrogenase cytochrome b subunit [Leptospiraceae bacterium]